MKKTKTKKKTKKKGRKSPFPPFFLLRPFRTLCLRPICKSMAKESGGRSPSRPRLCFSKSRDPVSAFQSPQNIRRNFGELGTRPRHSTGQRRGKTVSRSVCRSIGRADRWGGRSVGRSLSINPSVDASPTRCYLYAKSPPLAISLS